MNAREKKAFMQILQGLKDFVLADGTVDLDETAAMLGLADLCQQALFADGKIDLPKTAALLRLVKPYSLRGNPEARRLEQRLVAARADGEISDAESAEIFALLAEIRRGKLSLAEYVREIPDFPKPGILFRDVTGIFDNAEGFNLCLEMSVRELEQVDFDVVVAPESRGFIFGAALAAHFGKAFVPVRKPGKLPRATIHEDYALEYGTATLHMHKDALYVGERAVIVDDLLATGGTVLACARLVERLGGRVVKMLFPIELAGFQARTGVLAPYSVSSLIQYPDK